MRGAGDDQGIEKRLVMWARTCEPRPSSSRPFETSCTSLAATAVTIGLRANATAMPLPSSSRSVAWRGQGHGDEDVVLQSRQSSRPRSRPARLRPRPRATELGSCGRFTSSFTRCPPGQRAAQRGVIRIAPSQPDCFAVEHRVGDDVPTSAAYSDGLPEPAADAAPAGPERVHRLGRQRREHRGLEQSGRDRDDPDLALGQLAGDRQGHADNAALGGRVGRLPDLAVEGGHRRGVDDDAALLAVESASSIRSAASRITLNVPIRLISTTRRNSSSGNGPLLADDLGRWRDAGAVDDDAQWLVERRGGVERRRDRGGVEHVRRREAHARAESVGDARTGGLRQVEHHDRRTGRRERLDRRQAQAGRAAGDQGGRSCDIHALNLGRGPGRNSGWCCQSARRRPSRRRSAGSSRAVRGVRLAARTDAKEPSRKVLIRCGCT